MFPLLAKVGEPVEVTVWLTAVVQFHVTRPPTATVSIAGFAVPFRTLSNERFPTVTVMVEGAAASWPVTVTSAESRRVPAVITTYDWPLALGRNLLKETM